MLKRLHYFLLGGIAGLIVGIIPSLIVFFALNGACAIGALTGCVLVGMILGIIRSEKIEIFFDGLVELVTIW